MDKKTMKPHEEFIKELKETAGNEIGFEFYSEGDKEEFLKFIDEIAEKHFNNPLIDPKLVKLGDNPKQEKKSFSLNCHKSKDSVDSPVEDFTKEVDDLLSKRLMHEQTSGTYEEMCRIEDELIEEAKALKEKIEKGCGELFTRMCWHNVKCGKNNWGIDDRIDYCPKCQANQPLVKRLNEVLGE